MPSLLLRIDWLYWRDRFQSDYSRYPFLRVLVSRIEATFAGQPWRVELGDISCPYCGVSLEAGSFQPSCPHCRSHDLGHIDQWHSQIRDPWPPLV